MPSLLLYYLYVFLMMDPRKAQPMGTLNNAQHYRLYILCSSFVLLEKMFVQWERFRRESQALSQWINEREKELEAVCFKSSSDPLDKHISTVEVVFFFLDFLLSCLFIFYFFYQFVGLGEFIIPHSQHTALIFRRVFE